MTGDCRTSKMISTLFCVRESCGTTCLSQAVAAAPGVVASPSPVCQMPYVVAPAGPAEVWKPQIPPVLYSHTGLAEMPAARLDGCRIAFQPPSEVSKFQGTLSPPDGPLALNRMPR